MNKLFLKATSPTATLITAEIPGPRYEIRAWHTDTNTQGVLGTYNTPGEAMCKHFQLAAKFNLKPQHD